MAAFINPFASWTGLTLLDYPGATTGKNPTTFRYQVDCATCAKARQQTHAIARLAHDFDEACDVALDHLLAMHLDLVADHTMPAPRWAWQP